MTPDAMVRARNAWLTIMTQTYILTLGYYHKIKSFFIMLIDVSEKHKYYINRYIRYEHHIFNVVVQFHICCGGFQFKYFISKL